MAKGTIKWLQQSACGHWNRKVFNKWLNLKTNGVHSTGAFSIPAIFARCYTTINRHVHNQGTQGTPLWRNQGYHERQGTRNGRIVGRANTQPCVPKGRPAQQPLPHSLYGSDITGIASRMRFSKAQAVTQNHPGRNPRRLGTSSLTSSFEETAIVTGVDRLAPYFSQSSYSARVNETVVETSGAGL